MKFNRDTFFNVIRPTIQVSPALGLIQSQVDALNLLFDFIEADRRWDGMDEDVAINILAYFLGTVAHETGKKRKIGTKNYIVKTFEPVEEMGGNAYLNRMYDTRVDLGNTKARDGDGARNGGDGYVQNTGGHNARSTGKILTGEVITWEMVQNLDSRVKAGFRREGGSETNPITVNSGTFIREHELLRVPRISYLDAIDGMLTGRYTGRAIGDYINTKKTDYHGARRVINRLDKAALIAGLAQKMEDALIASLLGEVAFAEVEPNQKADEPENQPAEQPGATTQAAALRSEGGGFTAGLPQIDTARRWIKRGIAAASGLTITAPSIAFLTGLPLWLQIALAATFGSLLIAIVVGAIVIFVKYHKEIFAYVGLHNVTAMQTGTTVTFAAPTK